MKRKLKRTFTSFVAVVILVSTLLSSTVFAKNAYDEPKMYNINIYPTATDIKESIRTYSICFCSPTDKPAPGTYWALAQFDFTNLDCDENADKQTYGGYAGLQVLGSDKGAKPVAILSMFQKDEKKTDGTCATCMYPQNNWEKVPCLGKDEPACIHTIADFDWKGNHWYRMVLHCWNDINTGTTMIGMWIQDIETDRWTLIAYYDTKLENAAIARKFLIFQENFAPKDYMKRQYQIKGIYAKDTFDNRWKSLGRGFQKVDGSDKSTGVPKFGAYLSPKTNKCEYIYGTVDKGSKKLKDMFITCAPYTIDQDATPNFGCQKQNTWLKSKKNGSQLTVSWLPNSASTPQLTYKLSVYDAKGNHVRTIMQTRPDATSCTINNFNLNDYRCVLTVTDIFGRSMTQSCAAGACPQSIRVADYPTQTSFFIGSSLNTKGLSIEVTYGNGTKKKITNGFTTSGFNSKTECINKVYVNYQGLSTSYDVYVKKPSIRLAVTPQRLKPGEIARLSAVVDAPLGASAPAYEVNDPSVGKISWDSKGYFVQALKPGTVIVTAHINYNGVTYYSSDVTVNVSSKK